MPYAELAIAFVFATAFASGGEMEARLGKTNHGVLWALISLLVSAGVYALGGTMIWIAGAQLVLFVAIGAVRAKLAE